MFIFCGFRPYLCVQSTFSENNPTCVKKPDNKKISCKWDGSDKKRLGKAMSTAWKIFFPYPFQCWSIEKQKSPLSSHIKPFVNSEWNEKQGSEWEKVIVSELISDRTRFSKAPMKCWPENFNSETVAAQ